MHFFSKFDPEMIGDLSKRGAMVNCLDVVTLETPLACAVRVKNISAIRILLDLGADPSMRDLMGRSAVDIETSADIKKILKKNSGSTKTILDEYHEKIVPKLALWTKAPFVIYGSEKFVKCFTTRFPKISKLKSHPFGKPLPDDATHLLVNVNERGFADEASVAFCHAMSQRLMVVSENWISDSVGKESLLDFTDYLVHGCFEKQSDSLVGSKNVIWVPGIFKGLKFILASTKFPQFLPNAADLKKLISTAGGLLCSPRVTNTNEDTESEVPFYAGVHPKLSSVRYLVVVNPLQDVGTTPKKMMQAAEMKTGCLVSPSWILDCLWQNRIVDPFV